MDSNRQTAHLKEEESDSQEEMLSQVASSSENEEKSELNESLIIPEVVATLSCYLINVDTSLANPKEKRVSLIDERSRFETTVKRVVEEFSAKFTIPKVLKDPIKSLYKPNSKRRALLEFLKQDCDGLGFTLKAQIITALAKTARAEQQWTATKDKPLEELLAVQHIVSSIMDQLVEELEVFFQNQPNSVEFKLVVSTIKIQFLNALHPQTEGYGAALDDAVEAWIAASREDGKRRLDYRRTTATKKIDKLKEATSFDDRRQAFIEFFTEKGPHNHNRSLRRYVIEEFVRLGMSTEERGDEVLQEVLIYLNDNYVEYFVNLLIEELKKPDQPLPEEPGVDQQGPILFAGMISTKVAAYLRMPADNDLNFLSSITEAHKKYLRFIQDSKRKETGESSATLVQNMSTKDRIEVLYEFLEMSKVNAASFAAYTLKEFALRQLKKQELEREERAARLTDFDEKLLESAFKFDALVKLTALNVRSILRHEMPLTVSAEIVEAIIDNLNKINAVDYTTFLTNLKEIWLNENSTLADRQKIVDDGLQELLQTEKVEEREEALLALMQHKGKRFDSLKKFVLCKLAMWDDKRNWNVTSNLSIPNHFNNPDDFNQVYNKLVIRLEEKALRSDMGAILSGQVPKRRRLAKSWRHSVRLSLRSRGSASEGEGTQTGRTPSWRQRASQRFSNAFRLFTENSNSPQANLGGLDSADQAASGKQDAHKPPKLN